MRLAESARIDAELARRYRGLAPRIAGLNRSLLESAPSRVTQHDAGARGARSRARRAKTLDSPLVLMAARSFRARARAGRRRHDQRPPGQRALQLAPGADSAGARARRRRSAHGRRSGADAQRSDQRNERIGVADRRRRRRRRAGRRRRRDRPERPDGRLGQAVEGRTGQGALARRIAQAHRAGRRDQTLARRRQRRRRRHVPDAAHRQAAQRARADARAARRSRLCHRAGTPDDRPRPRRTRTTPTTNGITC